MLPSLKAWFKMLFRLLFSVCQLSENNLCHVLLKIFKGLANTEILKFQSWSRFPKSFGHFLILWKHFLLYIKIIMYVLNQAPLSKVPFEAYFVIRACLLLLIHLPSPHHLFSYTHLKPYYIFCNLAEKNYVMK